jgi:hypothetical protein
MVTFRPAHTSYNQRSAHPVRSRFLVLGSWFSVLSSRLSVLSSRFSALGSRFSVLGSWFLVLSSRFSVPGSQFLALGSWFSVLGSRFSVLGSWFSVPGSRFSVLGSRFSVLGSRLSALGSQFLVLGSQFSVLGSRFSVLGSQFSVLSREHPMKRLFLLLLIISAYAIAACSAPATTAPIVADSAPSGNVNIDNLPLNVDVATVRALQGRDDVILIDRARARRIRCRTHPRRAPHPDGEVPSRLNEIPTDKTVIVTCRSAIAAGRSPISCAATASPAFTICRVVCSRGKRPDTPSRSNQGRPGKLDISCEPG